MSPGFENYGVRPGDQIVGIDGNLWQSEKTGVTRFMWENYWELAHAPGDTVHIAVDRNGASVKATIECGNGNAFATAMIAAEEDRMFGRWQSCLSNVGTAAAISGRLSFLVNLRLHCEIGGDADQSRVALSEYDYARLVIAETQAGGGSLDSRRGDLLETVSFLESEGFFRLAEDLESKINTFSDASDLSPGGVKVGTCFAATASGRLLTAHHVVAGATQIRIRLSDGGWYPATVVSSSQANDVAVLSIESKTYGFLPLALPRSSRVGQRVFTMGYPAVSILGMEPKFSEGVVSALSGPGGEQGFIQVTVPVQPGNSGGPLVDESGRVVGIMTSTAAIAPFVRSTGSLPQNINWAIGIDFVRPLVEEARDLPSTSREGAIDRTRRALCFVEATL